MVTAPHRLALLETMPDPMFDSLTRHLADVWRVPMAAISLLDSDRKWFKSQVCLDASETSRAVSFCAHLMSGTESELVVCDALEDRRFADNMLVTEGPHIRFFAGVPLTDRDGARLGEGPPDSSPG
jgi:GAF domain-containing protein